MAKLSFQGQGVLKVTSAAATVSALAAAGEEDLSISDTDATVGDIIMVTPANAGAETGLAIVCAWVSTGGTIKLRVSNLNATDALVGGSRTFYYAILRA